MKAGFFRGNTLPVLALGLLSLNAHAAGENVYSDKNFQFTFSYPSDWTVMPSDTQGTRQVYVKPPTSRDASVFSSCMISVGQAVQNRPYTQAELNEKILQNPKSPEDWKKFFAPAKLEAPEVIEAKLSTVFGKPAHYSLIDDKMSQGGVTGLTRKSTYLTFTPNLSWNIACMAASFDRAKAIKHYAREEKKFRQIIDSLKITNPDS